MVTFCLGTVGRTGKRNDLLCLQVEAENFTAGDTKREREETLLFHFSVFLNILKKRSGKTFKGSFIHTLRAKFRLD